MFPSITGVQAPHPTLDGGPARTRYGNPTGPVDPPPKPVRYTGDLIFEDGRTYILGDGPEEFTVKGRLIE